MKVDFSAAIKGIFDNKESYKDFTQKDKEDNFFIINRYMAKNHPMMCQEINDKGLPKDVCMDIWSRYFKNVHKAPFWFWKKATKKEDVWPNSFKNADVKRLEDKEELDKELRVSAQCILQIIHIDLNWSRHYNSPASCIKMGNSGSWTVAPANLCVQFALKI